MSKLDDLIAKLKETENSDELISLVNEVNSENEEKLEYQKGESKKSYDKRDKAVKETKSLEAANKAHQGQIKDLLKVKETNTFDESLDALINDSKPYNADQVKLFFNHTFKFSKNENDEYVTSEGQTLEECFKDFYGSENCQNLFLSRRLGGTGGKENATSHSGTRILEGYEGNFKDKKTASRRGLSVKDSKNVDKIKAKRGL